MGVGVLLLAALASTGAARNSQPRTPVTPPPTARWEITPYVGAAIHSPAGQFLGIVPDRNHFFLGVHANVNVVRRDRWTFAYAPEVVPLLIVSDTPRLVRFTDETGSGLMLGDPGPVAGFAVSPFGAEAQRRLGNRWRAFGALAVGCVWFSREVPVPYSRSFNYTLEYGGGLLWRRGPRTSLRFGYKFHHLSNNYTAYQNPGLDAHVFLLGVSLNASPAQERSR